MPGMASAIGKHKPIASIKGSGFNCALPMYIVSRWMKTAKNRPVDPNSPLGPAGSARGRAGGLVSELPV